MAFPIAATAAAAVLVVENLLLEDVKIGDILVSACTGLSSPEESTATQKPIGEGYAITDAVVHLPRDVTLDIVFAPPQFGPEAIAAALLTGEAASLKESWQDKRDALKALRANKEIVTLQTHDESLPGMVITLIDPVYDNIDNWDGWLGTVTLHQINPVPDQGGGGLLDSALEAVGL